MTKEKPVKPTLSDDEVSTRRGLGRRSFMLGTIGGTAALAGCVQSSPVATGLTDRDSGAYADPAGNGRGTFASGITDRDSGAYADPAGRGRGQRLSGLTDRDAGPGADPAGAGRGACTDSDVMFGDPIGRGRRC